MLTRERRRRARDRKRKERALRGNEAIKAQAIAERAQCATLERLQKGIEERDGCWVWLGPFRALYGRVRPLVKVGQYGDMLADSAMFLVKFGRPPMKKCFIRTKCGNPFCIAPEHIYEANAQTERARRLLDGDQSR